MTYHTNGYTYLLWLPINIHLCPILCDNINNKSIVWFPFKDKIANLVEVTGIGQYPNSKSHENDVFQYKIPKKDSKRFFR